MIFVCLFLYNNTSNREWRGTWQVLFFQQKIFLSKSLDVRSVDIVRFEVDEFLDDVIKDYETYAALVKSLRQEIADLKSELSSKPQVTTPQPDSIEVTSSTSVTNFDILKRLNRLEKEVFGKQILDNQDL